MKERRVLGNLLRIVLLCVVFVVLSIALIACGCGGSDSGEQDGKSSVTFTGVKDVRISVAVTEYDFSKGVLAVDEDGKTLEITIDSSSVVFVTKGQYTVKYSTANGSQDCSVYIYGAPVIETTDLNISYEIATGSGSAIVSMINTTDTFGGIGKNIKGYHVLVL